MLIYLLAFVGGVLTILSPCILPVLPFVFARADQPFRRSGLPLLVGMALTFSLVAVAAAFGGHWVVRLNQGGRYVAMLVFLVLGVTPVIPVACRSIDSTAGSSRWPTAGRSHDRKQAREVVCAGHLYRIAVGSLRGADPGLDPDRRGHPGPRRSFIILVVVVCAGRRDLAGIALFAGNKAFSAMKRSLAFEVWIRRALGVAVIMGVVAIALGWDTNLLTKFSFVNTSKAEAHLINALGPRRAAKRSHQCSRFTARACGRRGRCPN